MVLTNNGREYDLDNWHFAAGSTAVEGVWTTKIMDRQDSCCCLIRSAHVF